MKSNLETIKREARLEEEKAILRALDIEERFVKSAHGSTFNSSQECYWYLKEEYQETAEKMDLSHNAVESLWHLIRADDYSGQASSLIYLEQEMFDVVFEALQTIAMIRKFKRTVFEMPRAEL